MKYFKRTELCKVGWFGLALISLLLISTACGDTTPVPQAATIAAVQSPLPSPSVISQTQPLITPGLTPTTTPQAVVACQSADLTVKSDWTAKMDWQTTPMSFLIGTVVFTNIGKAACNLGQLLQGHMLDKGDQVVGANTDFKLSILPNTPPASTTQMVRGETRSLTVTIQNKCEIKVGNGEPNFSLKLTFGTNPEISVPGANVEGYYNPQTGQFSCYVLGMMLSPFETTPGAAFTAAANIAQATAISDMRTHEAIYAATQTALPPTPTPTVIPTVVPGSKPCMAKDLSIDQAYLSAASQRNPKEWYLVNNSATACTLKGYPTLREVEPSGQVMPDFKTTHVNQFMAHKALDEAATPLISLPPDHAAQFMTDYQTCQESEASTVSLPMRTLEMLLPNNAGKIVMETRQSCPGNNSYWVSNFQYAPGDWHTLLDQRG